MTIEYLTISTNDNYFPAVFRHIVTLSIIPLRMGI